MVIGRRARKVKRDDAYDFVAGYTVANDYAIRDYLENWYRPNLRVKNRDGATPLGLAGGRGGRAGPDGLALKTTVNGRPQEGNTRDMIFDVPFLVEYFSSFMTRTPGDLILTGTPDGVVDCQPGDVVVTEIEGIGALMNTIGKPDMRIEHLIAGKQRRRPRVLRDRQPRHAGSAGGSGVRRRSGSQRRGRRRQGGFRLGRFGRASSGRS